MTVVDVSAHDPFVAPSRDFFQNPYPHYERLRSHGNIVWSRGGGEERWIVVGYDAGIKVLSDARFSVEVPTAQLEMFAEMRHAQNLIQGLTKNMLAQDPPQHTRVRKLANKAFTRAVVNELSGEIENIIDSLLNRVIKKGKMDIIEDFAFPLPITIVSTILGLPSSDQAQFREWSHAVVRTTEPVYDQPIIDAGAQAATELFDYLKSKIAERRQTPGDDLLSAFIHAEEEGDMLTLDELLANMLLLIIAGHETTVNLISSGMLELIQNPQAMQKLRTQPELVPSALEEMLRYQSPLQMTDRFAREDFEFDGQQLKKDQRLSVLIGALNRDPQQFESPDVFNIERQPNKHLAFGHGIHFCLGAPLARFEGKLAFEKLLSRLSNIELAVDEAEYKPSAGFRSLASLPITFDAG